MLFIPLQAINHFIMTEKNLYVSHRYQNSLIVLGRQGDTLIRRKYLCDNCENTWWTVPLLKSHRCKKCHSRKIEVIDYDHGRITRFSDHYHQKE